MNNDELDLNEKKNNIIEESNSNLKEYILNVNFEEILESKETTRLEEKSIEEYIPRNYIEVNGFKNFLFSLDGRISRKEYWYYYLSYFMTLFVIGFFLGVLGLTDDTNKIVITTIVIISTYPTLAVTIKRLHDFSMSGWLSLSILLGYFAILPIFIIGLVEGSKNKNDYNKTDTNYKPPKKSRREHIKYYPDFLISILILIVAVVITSLFSLLFVMVAGKSLIAMFFNISIISFITFIIVYIFVKDRYTNSFKGMINGKFKWSFLYSIIPSIIGVMMLNIAINSVLPQVKELSEYENFMFSLTSSKMIITLFIIPIVIIAPILEELIFRGMILRGLAGNYKVKTSILLSATLFSIIHLNLAQIPNAFFLGIIFAIIMIHTRNILYVIIYHAINNFIVISTLYFLDSNDFKNIPQQENNYLRAFAFAILGLISIYIGLKWIIKTTTNENRRVIPSLGVYGSYLSSFKDTFKSKK